MTETPESRLAALGLSLPEPMRALANYVPTVTVQNLLYVSGQISVGPEGEIKGKLGGAVSLEDGRKAAQICCLNILSQAKAALGSLDRISQAVRITGYVNAAPEFTDQAKVINGASDLLVSVLGECGRHSRAAVGVASLPFDAAVEIDAIFAIE